MCLTRQQNLNREAEMRELTQEEAEFVAGGGISQTTSGVGDFNFGVGSNYIYASVVAGASNATITTIVKGSVDFGGAKGSNG